MRRVVFFFSSFMSLLIVSFWAFSCNCHQFFQNWNGMNVFTNIKRLKHLHLLQYWRHLTLLAPKAILRFLQTKLISGESPEISIVWLLVIKIVQTFITWEMERPAFEHGIGYFKQFGAERVNLFSRRLYAFRTNVLSAHIKLSHDLFVYMMFSPR